MNRLSIFGMGTQFPPSVVIKDYAASLGADTSFYKSWDRACHARDDEQPSTMGSAALTKALVQSGVEARKIRLVLFTGVSRDYVPSWSVATEIMKLHGISDDCVGIDITIGCLATLSALDFAQGWLALRGGGYAAIVAAERWSHTVDKSDPSVAGMWVWSDGGAAMLVGMNVEGKSIADFVGAETTSRSDYNGHVLIPYGGTRQPVAPAGVSPWARTLSSRPHTEVRDTYARGYQRAYESLVRRVGIRGERLVCNQISPGTIKMIAENLGIPLERVVITGNEFGHQGAPDIITGLERLHQTEGIKVPVVLGASTAYAYGTGLVVPPLA